MTDYVFCSRNVIDGAFGENPGPTRFLAIPDGEAPSPDHGIANKLWAETVLAEANQERDRNKTAQAMDVDSNILIYIHGYNSNQDIIMKRHRKLKEHLRKFKFWGTLVSYDWPSDDKAISYLADRENAQETARRLVEDGLKLFLANRLSKCTCNLHILGHSTGAYVIQEAFRRGEQHASIADETWIISQIVLIGADLEREEFEPNGDTEWFTARANRVTNYVNPHDSALKMSNVKRLGFQPRVGRVGMPADKPDNCVDVHCGPYWEKIDEEKAVYFGNWSHSWHIGDELFAEDLVETLHGDSDRDSMPTRGMVDGKLTLGRRKPGAVTV